MKTFTVAALLTSMAVTTIAQAEVYHWQDELCDMTGDFDNKKYTSEQIKNSHYVLNALTSTNLNSLFPPMDIAALDKLSMQDLDKLSAEYKQVKRNVEQLNVVPEAKGYKQELLKSIDGEYQKDRLTILAYLNPSEALKQSPQMCKTYIAPLLQNETAVQTRWKQFVEEKIQQQAQLTNDGGEYYRNLATERYEREKANNPAKHAKIDLVTFGFSNCVNSQIYHADSEQVFSNYQKLNKTLFGKSFTQMCGEP